MADSQPVRKVRANSRSVTGFYLSRRGEKLEFESQLERDAYVFLDFDVCVCRIVTQPIRIARYVPDCLVETTSHGKFIAEIKYERELVMRWSELADTYSHANDYCVAEGLTYGFITDASIYAERWRLPLLKQVRFISQQPTNEEDSSLQKQLVAILSKGPLAIASLAQKLDEPLDYSAKLREICNLLIASSATVLQTPTPKLADCIVSVAGPNDSHRPSVPNAIVSYSRFLERIKTHPYRYLKGGVRVVS